MVAEMASLVPVTIYVNGKFNHQVRNCSVNGKRGGYGVKAVLVLMAIMIALTITSCRVNMASLVRVVAKVPVRW